MVSQLRNRLLHVYALTLCASLAASASASSGQTLAKSSEGTLAPDLLAGRTVASAPMRERLGGLRIPFVSNSGQADPAVAYYASTFAGTVYVTKKGEIVYSLPAPARPAEKTSRSDARVSRKAGRGWSLTETPVGGRARVKAEQPAVTQVSYFIGNDPERWRRGIATYDTVELGEVWPGVNLSLQARGHNVEKLFTVAPGADPSRIRMRVAGARSLRVNEAGALVARTGLGEVTFTRPVAYQERDGVRSTVTVAYRAEAREYGFSVSGQDPALPVVIDPLMQATYLGGSDVDNGLALTIHPTTGEVFVAGFTPSADFPGTTGGAQPEKGGGRDVFVARLNATLTTLNQATYLGGSGVDEGLALAIHPNTGEAFVTGLTDSTDFPGTTGGAQEAFAGGLTDVFVARFNATLTTLSQATYLGGSGTEYPGVGLAIHPTTGEVFVAGETDSSDFPAIAGGAQQGLSGTADAFVARFNANLTTLNQATYLGGSGGNDDGLALAIHPTTGEVFFAGTTDSTDFPGTTGGAQPTHGGGQFDAFITRFNATLTTLNQSTYLGGSGTNGDTGFALAIHPTTGEVFVAGVTDSTDFPGTSGGAQSAYGEGFFDGFVARLNATLTTLSQATYLGGGGLDDGRALAIHPTTGEVFVAGLTNSSDFPGTSGGAQPAYGGGSFDVFIARLNATLTTLSQATYLGGSDDEQGLALAILPTPGEVFVTGITSSTDFPGTSGGAQPASAGSGDVFVARLTADLAGNLVISPASGPAAGGTAVTIYGSLFQAGATVAVGGAAATDVTVVDATRLTAATPALTPGTLNDVVVTNPDTSSSTLVAGFFADFTDVPQGDIFRDFVEKIFRHGITAGCGGGNYCRDNPVRRDQMAVFLLKAEHGSKYAPPGCTGIFPDVPCPGTFTDWVEQLFSEGITGGCGGGNYCPVNPVTRQQMAVFLLKTEHGSAYIPPTCAGLFDDVACPSLFADWIEQLYAEQVTGGCSTNPLLYCPANPVTRGQMAVFLVKTFGLQ